jgi:hypothetical protein
VFAPPINAPFVSRRWARYNSTLFVHEALEGLHERLAFRIVKEQPITLLAKRQAQAASTSRLRLPFPEKRWWS